jgi:hypothetical protein
VAFSTTKGLQTGQFRSGICFSKWNYGSLCVQSEWHHGIHGNVYAGLLLMKQFTPDTAYEAYFEHQQLVCNYFGLTPSHTIHIALGDQDWNFFHRDTIYNRINIRLPLLDSYNGVFDLKIYTDAQNRNNSGTYGVNIAVLSDLDFNPELSSSNSDVNSLAQLINAQTPTNRPIFDIICIDDVNFLFRVDKIR